MIRITAGQMEMLKKFMKESCFTCTDEWLLACVQWISEENNNPPFNLEFYKRELREQWQDANLTEMESVCLPPDLAGQRLVKLPGKYGLQVVQIQDIGESSYNQYKKLKKLENENNSVAATDSNEVKPAWEPTPKRCLHLTMTDGSQDVFGIEKAFIPAFNINMKPGVKIIIMGPLECRRGVMHLRPNNVRVIGGEVEQLVEANTLENVLSKRLNLTNRDPRPQPGPTTRSAPTRNQTQLTQAVATAAPTPSTSAINSRNEEISGEFPDSEGAFPDISDFGDDDDIFMQIDESAIIQASERVTAASGSARSNNNQSASLNSSIFDKTTQRVQSSRTPNHEDEDDVVLVEPSAPSRPATSSSSTASSFGNNKTKTAFVPPIKTTGSSNSSISAKASFVPPPPVKKPTSTFEQSFQSAKTLMKRGENSKGASASGTGKQLNIMQYMKPMPVIIDPPTPERQAAKRRRTEENAQSKLSIEQSSAETEVLVAEQNESEATADGFDDDDLFPSSPSDDALMQIIDETIESKLLEESENPNSSSATQSTSSIRANSTSSISVPQKCYPVKVPPQPYVFLKQVLQRIDELTESRKVIHVRACISTIVSSNIEIDRWAICVSINDGTGNLDCGINAEIVNGIVGFSPGEMKKIGKTKEGKQRVKEGLANLTKTLIHSNAIFGVEMGPQPMIIEIAEVLHHHFEAVKNRLKEIGL